jgi:transposase-like protein
MIAQEPPALKRREIRAILKRHPGSISRIARELGHSTHVTVSKWLKNGGTSKPVEEAATREALRLLEEEKNAAA